MTAAGGLDLRLVPAAAAAWAATAAALHAPPVVSAAAGAATVAAGVALLVADRRSGPRHRLRSRWAATVGVLLVVGAAAALGTAARVAVRDASPLARLAGQATPVTVELTLTDDPRRIAGGFDGAERVLVAGRASAVRCGSQRWRVHDDVVVLADAEGWSGLLPGQRAIVDGGLLPALGGDLVAAAVTARGPPVLLGEPPALQRAAGNLRGGLVTAAAILPAGPRGLLPGLVVGDTSRMDPLLVEQFRETGLSHLVAVSGANCAIVVGAVIWLLRRVGLPTLPLVLVAGLALAGFVVLARPSPSVLRAATMGAIALVALAAGRSRSALPALAATVLVLVLAVPELAWAPGFALSVAATAGIVLLAPGLTRSLRARRVPAGAAEALAVSLAACLATAPLVATLSSAVSLVSVPANVLAAPAVPPATVLGVLATVVSPVSGTAATALVWLAGWPARWIVLVAEHGSRLPQASQPWPGGAPGGLLLGALLVLASVAAARWPLARRTGLAVGCAVLLVALPIRVVAPGWPPAGWLFVACDVGQGDALVVNAGPGTALVVDAGPEPAAVNGCLRDLGVRQVPLLLLTHMHADHVDGVTGVLVGRSVGRIEIGPQPEPTSALAAVRRAAGASGVPVVPVSVGPPRRVGGVELTVLAPVVAATGTDSDENNSSLVLRVSTAGLTLLLAGDIELPAQASLQRSGTDLDVDVLKVAHHGSAYQDEAFLDAVHARVAVISVGADNTYGHPSPGLLMGLRERGMRVLRTDLDGAVAVGVGSDERLWVAAQARDPPR